MRVGDCRWAECCHHPCGKGPGFFKVVLKALFSRDRIPVIMMHLFCKRCGRVKLYPCPRSGATSFILKVSKCSQICPRWSSASPGFDCQKSYVQCVNFPKEGIGSCRHRVFPANTQAVLTPEWERLSTAIATAQEPHIVYSPTPECPDVHW